jgi:hypothetical protein
MFGVFLHRRPAINDTLCSRWFVSPSWGSFFSRNIYGCYLFCYFAQWPLIIVMLYIIMGVPSNIIFYLQMIYYKCCTTIYHDKSWLCYARCTVQQHCGRTRVTPAVCEFWNPAGLEPFLWCPSLDYTSSYTYCLVSGTLVTRNKLADTSWYWWDFPLSLTALLSAHL